MRMNTSPHEFFHALSDGTRLRCLALLCAEGELCVCDLVRALDMAQPRISRHLALLRDMGLVKARREGVWMHYHLDPAMLAWRRVVLETSLPVLAESEQGLADRARLHASTGACAV